MNDAYVLNVADEFSPRPFGRYRSDGERSAEEFREKHLIPAMSQHEHVTVDLSGTNYYGSSFLEETFGGLVRAIRTRKVLDITEDDLNARLKIVHEKLPSIEEEAKQYIQEAWKA
ncbi:MAG: STAS-like domain-containing protein [Alphaproteobacteria bacterium]|nr:STAS-like domain-containing protein [Alphaproteobacteria bacterium]